MLCSEYIKLLQQECVFYKYNIQHQYFWVKTKDVDLTFPKTSFHSQHTKAHVCACHLIGYAPSPQMVGSVLLPRAEPAWAWPSSTHTSTLRDNLSNFIS